MPSLTSLGESRKLYVGVTITPSSWIMRLPRHPVFLAGKWTRQTGTRFAASQRWTTEEKSFRKYRKSPLYLQVPAVVWWATHSSDFWDSSYPSGSPLMRLRSAGVAGILEDAAFIRHIFLETDVNQRGLGHCKSSRRHNVNYLLFSCCLLMPRHSCPRCGSWYVIIY